MDHDLDSQHDRNAAWFRARAAQCFRLSLTVTQPQDAETLRALGQDFEAQAKLAEEQESRDTMSGEQATRPEKG